MPNTLKKKVSDVNYSFIYKIITLPKILTLKKASNLNTKQSFT